MANSYSGPPRTQRSFFSIRTADRKHVPIAYDYLILATGATHIYFGRDEFATHAPELKTLADAVAIRNKILQAFEQAETQEDTSIHRDLLTFVLVGACPAKDFLESYLYCRPACLIVDLRMPRMSTLGLFMRE